MAERATVVSSVLLCGILLLTVVTCGSFGTTLGQPAIGTSCAPWASNPDPSCPPPIPPCQYVDPSCQASAGEGQLFVLDKMYSRTNLVTEKDTPIFLVLVVPGGAVLGFVAIILYVPPDYATTLYLIRPWTAVGSGAVTFGGVFLGPSDASGTYGFKALLWYTQNRAMWWYSEPIAFVELVRMTSTVANTTVFSTVVISSWAVVTTTIEVQRSDLIGLVSLALVAAVAGLAVGLVFERRRKASIESP